MSAHAMLNCIGEGLLRFGPLALPLVTFLVIVLLVEKTHRREWIRRHRWWIALGWATWTAVLLSVILVAEAAKKNAWWWLGDALLRGLSTLWNAVWTPWFALSGVILFMYGQQVGDLLKQVAKNVRTLEVSGVRIGLGEPSPVLTDLTVGWWSDKPDEGATDAVGSDGPIQERPLGPYPEYENSLKETEKLLSHINQQNHWDYGRGLRRLEWSWIGEYAEQLEHSVRLLRQAIREQRVQLYTYRYLATGLAVRHMMLYMYGRLEHAGQLFEDLHAIEKDSLIYVLKEPITFWFLIHLCDRRQFTYAQQLVRLDALKDTELGLIQRSLQAYLELKQGKYEQAVCQATAALSNIDPTASDVALPRTVLHYVLAMASLKVGTYSVVVPHALAVLKDTGIKAQGLRSYLRRHAIRLYVKACYQLKQHDRITQLLIDEPEASLDPYVLNALAVALHNEGDTKAAASLLMRAMDLLPPSSEDELRRTILSNHELMRT